MMIFDVPRLDFNRFTSVGWCELRVYENADQIIAVVTEVIKPDGNYASEGLSITNGIEAIAPTIVDYTHRPFTQIIEHYPDRGYRLDLARSSGRPPQFEEGFALVAFQKSGFRHPVWKYIQREEVERLIGEPFPVLS